MDITTAINLLLSYNVPEHIIAHSYKVTKVAYIISDELLNNGIKINKMLIINSSILHDITKYDSILNKGEDHAETGGIFMRKLGYPDIAEIIENHIIIKDKKNFLLEKKIVFYADKRVMHDKIVSLKERYNDLINRYGKSEYYKNLIKDGFKKASLIEEEIFKHLPFKPDYFNLLF